MSNAAFYGKNKACKIQQQAHDSSLLASTGRCLKEPVFLEDGTMILPQSGYLSANGQGRRLFRPKSCYTCREKYSEVHHFYHRLCPNCAEINFRRRSETGDLRGRVAIVTGGRIKIGYEIALKLLRAGAFVMITTRFKRDAAARYASEPDFSEWRDRLQIFGLDLRHIPSVESFIEYLVNINWSIDILSIMPHRRFVSRRLFIRRCLFGSR